MSKLTKFTKDYCPPKGDIAPQGESSEEFLAKKNSAFMNYISSKSRPQFVKNTVGNYYKAKAGSGLEIPSNEPDFDPSGLNQYNPDQYWLYHQMPDASVIQPPAKPDFGNGSGSFDSSLLKGKPQEILPSIQTTGYKDPNMVNGPYGPYSPSTNTIPKYVSDMKTSPAMQNSQPGKLKMPENIGMGKMKTTPSGMPMFDGTEIFTAISADYHDRENRRKEKWLDNQMAIENVVPISYGSRGDYDINQGNFRPDRRMKNGGENKMKLSNNEVIDIAGSLTTQPSSGTLNAYNMLSDVDKKRVDSISKFKSGYALSDVPFEKDKLKSAPGKPQPVALPLGRVDDIQDSTDYLTGYNKGRRGEFYMGVNNVYGRGYFEGRHGKLKKEEEGGQHEGPPLKKAFWGALIALIPAIMNQKKQKDAEQQQQQDLLEQQKLSDKEAEGNARMNIITGAQSFQPEFKMGGSKKCYKKGGSYSVDESELIDLIKQGYEVEFTN